ncbi:MarR family transcriptional regulator [Mesorhizobium sp. SB112]|uniref:MarR family winged helix-turn-helix transcriptional regulator n=1 Tax=Mesorhizobium sp. SB112 TaxID=3151853 RepID=UPI0032670161
MTEEILALEAFLPYRLNRIADAVSQDFARLYKERHGLTRPEWRTFATLGQYGTMTATAIGEHSSMHKTKVSRAVAELEKRKWLVRETVSGDRRVENLTLTKAGRQIYREMVPLAKGFEAKLLERMSAPDRAAVAAGIAALEKLLKLRGAKVSPDGADSRGAAVSGGPRVRSL